MVFLRKEKNVVNNSSSGSKNSEQAIVGFITYKSAEGFIDRSNDSYERTLRQWAELLSLYSEILQAGFKAKLADLQPFLPIRSLLNGY